MSLRTPLSGLLTGLDEYNLFNDPLSQYTTVDDELNNPWTEETDGPHTADWLHTLLAYTLLDDEFAAVDNLPFIETGSLAGSMSFDGHETFGAESRNDSSKTSPSLPSSDYTQSALLSPEFSPSPKASSRVELIERAYTHKYNDAHRLYPFGTRGSPPEKQGNTDSPQAADLGHQISIPNLVAAANNSPALSPPVDAANSGGSAALRSPAQSTLLRGDCRTEGQGYRRSTRFATQPISSQMHPGSRKRALDGMEDSDDDEYNPTHHGRSDPSIAYLRKRMKKATSTAGQTHVPSPAEYFCGKCRKSFKHERYLIRHFTSLKHTGSMEGKCACRWCGKNLSRADAVTRHLGSYCEKAPGVVSRPL
ncbi:hypothetical protein PUNSTDRAFT_135342 [Punctularia strigosozonata HHB-11173 SS5]|uniref:uncharacterized protein n=1 Tax=Punctularia strigosozonata (strain HHB-11173) TaxID=741275 RepID=UPI0004418384|nr:uncharacterized protein PUNSTDRAFT_135342 [Punctularia strigosozonata HHB-11173 SS5]EIN07827.1 hypothetical protein PUNSTDRAFT_135342 [Punctularia strigosozonata HHB-11173 SS5]